MSRSVPALLLGVLAGCASSESARSPVAPAAPDGGLPPDSVRVPAASMRFLKVDTAGGEGPGEGGVLRVPAKVTFKEGALSRVSAPLAGRVAEVHVKTGDQVRAAAPLITLDCPEAAAARAQLLAAEAAVREARTALDRERRMLAEGVGIERERLAAEKRLVEAEAELRRTRSTVAFVGPGAGSQVVLRAPLAGVVISRAATAGAAVTPGGDPLVEVGDPTRLWVVADVFERDLTRVQDGLAAMITLSNLPAPVPGRVASVGATVSAGVRTAQVRVLLDGQAGALKPGMFGQVELRTDESGITLPARAVVIHESRMVVYVERGAGVFQRRPVTVGQSVDGRVRVTDGLRRGERVVTDGALLIDGAVEELL